MQAPRELGCTPCFSSCKKALVFFFSLWYNHLMNATITEADILNDMVSPDLAGFPPEVAKALLELCFTPPAIERMNDLAEKNREDIISAAEKDEMEKYRRVGNFVSFVQAKACLSLAKHNAVP